MEGGPGWFTRLWVTRLCVTSAALLVLPLGCLTLAEDVDGLTRLVYKANSHVSSFIGLSALE